MGAAHIREAGPEDLPGIAALLGVRDGLPGPHPGAARALYGLEPARLRAWIAVDGDAIVGISCAELHQLQIADSVIQAGYWTNLYIREDYRDQLLYPRLPQAMLRSLQQAGVSRVYLAIHRLEVAKGHLRIGFRAVEHLCVRIKPLRPASLLGKQFGLPAALVRAAGIVDRVAALPLRAVGWRPALFVGAAERLSLPVDAEPLARLLNRVRAGLVTRSWTADALSARLAPAPDGRPYTLLGLRRRGELVGATIVGTTVREGGLKIGVVLELAARDDDPRALARLLWLAERELYAHGVDGVLALDALGPSARRTLVRAGYLATKQRYLLMVAPKRAIADDDRILDASAWRFPLSDHDAF